MIEPLSATAEPGLVIEVLDRSDACLVRLAGDLDAASGVRLESMRRRARQRRRPGPDLRLCGPGVLRLARLRSLIIAARRTPGAVSVVRPPANLRRLLDLTGAEILFEVRER